MLVCNIHQTVKVVEWLTRSPAISDSRVAVQRMPSGAQVRILSLTHIFLISLLFLFLSIPELSLGRSCLLGTTSSGRWCGTRLTYIRYWIAIAERWCKVPVLSVGEEKEEVVDKEVLQVMDEFLILLLFQFFTRPGSRPRSSVPHLISSPLHRRYLLQCKQPVSL